MTHVIKFRAWSPSKKEMFYQKDQYLASFIRRFVLLETDKSTHESYLVYPGQDVAGIEPYLMQFAGHKDRTNDEIYESDIVEDEDGQRFTIIWDDYGQWWASERTGEWSMSLGELIDDCVVIGNIHENPELMEVK